MKIEKFFWEKVKFDKFSTESENFSKIGGDLKQVAMHSLHYLTLHFLLFPYIAFFCLLLHCINSPSVL